MRTLSDGGRTLLEELEGLRLKAYQDQTGVLTIGYGHTGPDVKLGMVIDKSRAVQLLDYDVRWAEAAVDKVALHAISQHQFDALVCWEFNTGGLATPAAEPIRKCLLANDMAGVLRHMRRWDHIHVNGKVVVDQGLVHRRAKEAAWFLTPDEPEVAPAPEHPVLSITELPPTTRIKPVPPPVKAHQTTTGRMQIGAAVSGGAAAVAGTVSKLQPAIDAGQQVTGLFTGMSGWQIAIVGALVAGSLGFTGYTYWHKKKSMENAS